MTILSWINFYVYIGPYVVLIKYSISLLICGRDNRMYMQLCDNTVLICHTSLYCALRDNNYIDGGSLTFSPNMKPDQLNLWLLQELGDDYKDDIDGLKSKSDIQ